MNDEIRSNRDEFLSFLGTCMTFYNMHLTPYEQDHIMAEMGKILHDHLAPKNYSKLMKYVYGEKNPAYMDTDSYQEIKKVFTSGQTLVPMPGIEKLPELRGEYIKGGGETDGNDQI